MLMAGSRALLICPCPPTRQYSSPPKHAGQPRVTSHRKRSRAPFRGECINGQGQEEDRALESLRLASRTCRPSSLLLRPHSRLHLPASARAACCLKDVVTSQRRDKGTCPCFTSEIPTPPRRQNGMAIHRGCAVGSWL